MWIWTVLGFLGALIFIVQRVTYTETFWLIDDRLCSAILRSLEQTHCAHMWFFISDQLFIAHFSISTEVTSVLKCWHGWCHMELLTSWRRFCVHHTTMLHVTSCKATYICKVHACLAVTCHLHFWQHDRDLLYATAVTRGWNGYRNKSQHRKSTLEKKILLPLLHGFEPTTFQSRVHTLTSELSPPPETCGLLMLALWVHRMSSCAVVWKTTWTNTSPRKASRTKDRERFCCEYPLKFRVCTDW